MAKRLMMISALCLGLGAGAKTWWAAQSPSGPANTIFRVAVDMVQLDVAVTDKRGNYITGLNPRDFEIYEDGIAQKLAGFGEENEAPQRLADYSGTGVTAISLEAATKTGKKAREGPAMQEESPDQIASMTAGANVFILFDTSNYMYRGFVYAQDAITEFVRTLDHPYRVAFYSFSRNISRICPLSLSRSLALAAVRKSVAGDDAALYDALLLTLKDAATCSGRKVIVVFSNGPDNASMVAPEDVRELAQTEGVAIYMVSTQLAHLDATSTAVFGRISSSTGGKSYFAKGWQDQQKAFAAIRDDLAHLYTLTYYPQPNPNYGWRSITVKLRGTPLREYRLRARSGYRPRTNPHFIEAATH